MRRTSRHSAPTWARPQRGFGFFHRMKRPSVLRRPTERLASPRGAAAGLRQLQERVYRVERFLNGSSPARGW